MNWRKNLYVLCFCNFFANIGFNMVIPFMPVILQQNAGVTDNLSFWSGMMSMMVYFTYVIVQPIWGSMADRSGKRMLLLRSGLGIGLSYFMIANCRSIWALLAVRALNGALMGFIPASNILLSSTTPSYAVGYALGTLNMAVAVGTVLGPVVGGALVESLGITYSLYFGGIIMLIVGLAAFFGTEEQPIPANVVLSPFWQDVKEVLADPGIRTPIFCLFTLNMCNQMILPILPLFVAGLQAERAQLMVGVVYSISAVSLALGSPLINKLHGRKYHISYAVILVSCLLLAGGTTLLQGLASGLLFLVIQRFIYGFFQSGITVASNVLVAINAPDEKRGRVFSLVNSIASTGFIIGPVIGGNLGEINYRVPFIAAALFFCLAGVYLWQWQKRNPGGIEKDFSDDEEEMA